MIVMLIYGMAGKFQAQILRLSPGAADAVVLIAFRTRISRAPVIERRMLMTLFTGSLGWLAGPAGWLLVLLVAAAIVTLLGGWVIRADQSGLVIKKFGAPLASGRFIALDGEAGYQARMLSPGWHFGYW